MYCNGFRRAQVVALVNERLLVEPNVPSEPQLQRGGLYAGRPTDFALSRQNYYPCHKCSKPYFGGFKACGAGPVEGGQQSKSFLDSFSRSIS